MAYFITPNVTADNSAFPLRQAEGKVLGRVRSLVKGSTPRAGVKDYRFFVDPLSSLPPEMGEGPRFGFTGFMSRSGYGFNAFAGEEEALARLQEDLGGSFVTFTPALRNNKFFVLDDLKKEGRTPFMEQDEDYRPVPAFGRQGEPAMEGDINKFCRHLLEGKPIPGLSKKYWNNDFTPTSLLQLRSGTMESWATLFFLHLWTAMLLKRRSLTKVAHIFTVAVSGTK